MTLGSPRFSLRESEKGEVGGEKILAEVGPAQSFVPHFSSFLYDSGPADALPRGSPLQRGSFAVASERRSSPRRSFADAEICKFRGGSKGAADPGRIKGALRDGRMCFLLPPRERREEDGGERGGGEPFLHPLFARLEGEKGGGENAHVKG